MILYAKPFSMYLIINMVLTSKKGIEDDDVWWVFSQAFEEGVLTGTVREPLLSKDLFWLMIFEL
jgi:hypothetical protein